MLARGPRNTVVFKRKCLLNEEKLISIFKFFMLHKKYEVVNTESGIIFFLPAFLSYFLPAYGTMPYVHTEKSTK